MDSWQPEYIEALAHFDRHRHPQYFLRAWFNEPSKMTSAAMVNKRHFHGRLDEMHESFISSAHLYAPA